MTSQRIGPLSGYPEFLPAGRIVEQHVLDTVRHTFELHGFASIQTRAVEPLDVLLRKGEIDKEVYVVRRLQAADDGSGDAEPSADALALHFDLTVPFARYVLEHAGHLTFPFRRYQIQPAWRGERPQEGRYREFVQADIDVVDRDSLATHHDVEVVAAMADVFARLPLPAMTMQVSSRKVIDGFCRGLGLAEQTGGVLRALDKLDKLSAAAVAEQVAAVGLSAGQVDAVLQLAAVRTSDPAALHATVAGLGVRHELLDEGLGEVTTVLAGVAHLVGERLHVVADLSIARGLDYYTGTVVETRMAGFESLGSICSGGRYEALASDGRTTYPGMGLSFGVTRTLAPLIGKGMLVASRPTPTVVAVAVADEASRPASTAVADALRARGVATEVVAAAQRYGKQIRSAQRRGIPFVWFPPAATESGEHEVRDIRSGEQVPADPAAWLPPASDRQPTVVARGGHDG